MKAITIKQPWASLIVHGTKAIENRTWRTNFRGRILIHSAQSIDISRSPLLSREQFKAVGGKEEYQKHYFGNCGCIIGSVEIVGCVVNHPSIWAEKTDGYPVGMNPRAYKDITGTRVVYNWVLANPIFYEKPIENVKGKLSFWDYPGIEEVKIECPECGSIELAIENYTTAPWHTYLHKCRNCGEYIMESEWEKVKE